jgi:hypothetical protein
VIIFNACPVCHAGSNGISGCICNQCGTQLSHEEIASIFPPTIWKSTFGETNKRSNAAYLCRHGVSDYWYSNSGVVKDAHEGVLEYWLNNGGTTVVTRDGDSVVEEFDEIRRIKTPAHVKWVGATSGHIWYERKDEYYTRIEAVSPEIHADICGYCGAINSHKDNYNQWTSYRTGHDCYRCGGN